MTTNSSPGLTDRRIVLGVSGSIAAYKAADIASQLGHLGADVFAVLTPNAERFVGAATFRALTRNPVLSGVFDEPFHRQIAHIELAQQADLILVAPATANILAKMAHGIADDMLSTLLLAATAPDLVAPAMNAAMWEHPATRANLALLRERGVSVVEPAVGLLACQTEGQGRLAEVDDILQAVVRRLAAPADYQGLHVLVTAGPTREPLDPVRYLSNRSSGRMGYAIAEAALARGARVTLVTGPAALAPPEGAAVVRVETTEEMLAACVSQFADADVFVAAAAPADYGPAVVQPAKMKKAAGQGGFSLALRHTPDILGALSADKGDRTVVGFAAETEDLIAHAKDKLARKQLDLIVANDVTAEGAGFEVDTNVVTLVWPDGRTEALPRLPKREVADRLLDAARRLVRRTPRRSAP